INKKNNSPLQKLWKITISSAILLCDDFSFFNPFSLSKLGLSPKNSNPRNVAPHFLREYPSAQ
ncbi:MAG: hypothetical protein AAF985_19240, partial [Bacteroidota bacterium]